jgi:hypothetical protein
VTTLNAAELAELPLSERVAYRAGAVDWRRILLLVLLALPYVLGWTARLLVRTVGWVLAYGWAAAVEGYAACAPKREGG